MARREVSGAGGNGSGYCPAFAANLAGPCKVTAIADVNLEAPGRHCKDAVAEDGYQWQEEHL